MTQKIILIRNIRGTVLFTFYIYHFAELFSYSFMIDKIEENV